MFSGKRCGSICKIFIRSQHNYTRLKIKKQDYEYIQKGRWLNMAEIEIGALMTQSLRPSHYP